MSFETTRRGGARTGWDVETVSTSGGRIGDGVLGSATGLRVRLEDLQRSRGIAGSRAAAHRAETMRWQPRCLPDCPAFSRVRSLRSCRGLGIWREIRGQMAPRDGSIELAGHVGILGNRFVLLDRTGGGCGVAGIGRSGIRNLGKFGMADIG